MPFIKHFPGLTKYARFALVFYCGLLLVGFSSAAVAEIKIELDKTEITGARELPKILYVVPWKQSAPDPRPLPMRSLVEELLTPIDMDEFRRQVRYYGMTNNPTPSQSTLK